MIAFSLHMFTSIHCAPQKIRGHEWHVWAWAFGDHVIVWQSPGTGIQSQSSFAIRHSVWWPICYLPAGQSENEMGSVRAADHAPSSP